MAIKLYGFKLSGHSHRVEVFLSLLDLEYEFISVDVANGEHKQPEFLAKNNFGQIPVLADGNFIISDSNAILYYLANTYDKSRQWFPANIKLASEIQKYLSVASGQIAYGPAAARLVKVFGAELEHQVAIDRAHQVLNIINCHLANKNWLVGESASIADVANYSYIAHAPEGDVSLKYYPYIQDWLARFEALPGFIPMPKTPAGLAK
ncbi:glutathione S-transferase family protein [Catenovulum adriaticum]